MQPRFKQKPLSLAATLALILCSASGSAPAATTFSPAEDGHGGVLNHDCVIGAAQYKFESYLDGIRQAFGFFSFCAPALVAGLQTGHAYRFVYTPADATGAPIAAASEVSYTCAPVLSIARAGNVSTLSWPMGFSGFHVQGSDSVLGPWKDFPSVPGSVGSRYTQSETNAAPVRFYRLKD